MKKVLIILLALAVFVALAVFPRMVESSIPSAYYVTPAQTTHEQVLSCAGTLRPVREWEVYVPSPALPDSVLVSEGDVVEEGQLLFTLKPSSLADEALSALRGNANFNLPDADMAAVAALYGLSTAVGGGLTDYTELAGLLSLLEEERAGALTTTLADPGQREVRAPMAGLITAVNARAHVPALPGLSLVRISDISGYTVAASVPESDIAKVILGQRAEIRCNASPAAAYSGTVTRILPTARKALRGTAAETVVDIELALDELPSGASGYQNLRPGYTAKVQIQAGGRRNTQLITVPYEAVRQDENNDEYVYVYEAGIVRRNSVITGQELVSEVEIVSGLTTESIVVFNPGDLVREGGMIQLRGRADVD